MTLRIARPARLVAVAAVVWSTACTGVGDEANAGAGEPLVVPVGISPPALARAEPWADTLYGVVVPDAYRWMEDTTRAETQAWIASQARYVEQVMARLVGRDSLQALVERAYGNTPTLDLVRETPRGLLLTRWLGEAPSLFVVDSGSTTERRLLTAGQLAGGRDQASGRRLRAMTPSWSGALIALGTTDGGDRHAAISVIESTTGKSLPDSVPDLPTSTSGTRYEVTWLPNDSGFFYPRLRPGSDSVSPADRLARGRQFLHRLGTPQSEDIPVFGFDVSPDVPMDAADLPTRIHTAPGSSWLVATLFRAAENGTEMYAARIPSPLTSAPTWTLIARVNERMTAPQLRGDTVYALSRNNADRGRVVRRVLGAATSLSPRGPWDVVIPEQRGVTTAFSVQADGIYATVREQGVTTLLHMAPNTSTPDVVALPATGTVRLSRGQPSRAGVAVSVESWASPPHWLHVQAGDSAGTAVIAPLLADDGSAIDTTSTISERLEAQSRDGTMVPVSLVYGPAALRDGVLDGTAPLLIDAYGGFGVVTDPFYYPLVHAWVALGGVFAHAHVRGGGELGESWHLAATRENKQRSIDDMLGAIDALIARNYTSAGRVTITGTSFGANIPGLAMLQRPSLFGAVLFEVGQPDEIRGAQFDPTAARNIAELGDLDSPSGIRLLMQASPYHQVPDTISLPAVIVHTAADDYNFGTQMLTAKYVARLQAANTGTRPILWLRTGGGHRDLFSLSPEWAARTMAFVLWQSGVERYQPPPATPADRE